MSNKKNVTISDFYCIQCGRKGIPLARKIGSQREAGHLKKLYCIYCQEEVNHVEIRPFGSYTLEDFKLEFEMGRFVNGKRIPLSDLFECTNNTCKYNIKGRCWNCKEDFNCKHKIKEQKEVCCK